MFSGIIEAVGVIKGIMAQEGGKIFSVKVPFKPVMGESISLSGVCVTVSGLLKEGFNFFASDETLSRTTLGLMKIGDNVNLERAVPASGRFGGHFVTGHVDGIGSVVAMEKRGKTIYMRVEIPEELSDFVVQKGSIAVDGISLTVNEVSKNIFSVVLIPMTLKLTCIERLSIGSKVNIEVDLIAKLVFNSVKNLLNRKDPGGQNSRKGITKELLIEAGFININNEKGDD